MAGFRALAWVRVSRTRFRRSISVQRADATGIERNDDPFAAVERDHSIDIVGGLVADRRWRWFELVAADTDHLTHAVDQ